MGTVRKQIKTGVLAIGAVAKKKHTYLTGFEPVRGDPNGFLVHRLNHSATTTTWQWM